MFENLLIKLCSWVVDQTINVEKNDILKLDCELQEKQSQCIMKSNALENYTELQIENTDGLVQIESGR